MTAVLPAPTTAPTSAPTSETKAVDPGITYVLERFPVLSETFVSAEIEQLREMGVPVSVVTTRLPVASWGSGDRLDGPPSGLERGVLRSLGLHGTWLRRSPRRYLSYLRVLARAPLKDKPFVLLAPLVAEAARSSDATHLHTHFAFRAASVARGVAALLGLPRSVTTHANDIFVRTRFLGPRLAGAKILTISRHNQAFLAGLGFSSEVNHCGVDVASAVDPRGLGATPVLLFVGRLVPKKGPLAFLRAVAELVEGGRYDLSVRMVGDGPLMATCREYAAQRRLPVSFLGSRPRQETLAEIAGATAVCLPCVVADDGDLDGIPVVLMEAMALGTPVVTTAVSGIPELVDRNCGWLVEASDGQDLESALAAALADLMTDPDEVRRRVLNARVRVESAFTVEAQAEGLLRAVREAAPC